MSNTNQLIIIVDDDPEMNLAVRRLLNAAGFHTRSFPSAEALLASNELFTAAFLILDVNLPGLSGFQLYRRLQERGVRLPVVFTTAYDNSESQNEAAAAGALAYLPKPFIARPLLAAIAQALQPA